MTLITIAALLIAQDPDTDRARLAAEHFAMWNGRWPASLDELVTKPSDAKVWPDGGFLEKKPEVDYVPGKLAGKDLVLRIDNTDGIAVEVLVTRYRLAQARTAAAAYRAKHRKWPATLADLGVAPKDAWGNDFRLETSEAAIRISSPGRKLDAGAPTDAQRKRVAELLPQLSADWIQDRDAAAVELDKMGVAVVPLLEDALKKTTENGARKRLEKIIGDRRAEERTGTLTTALSVHVFASPAGGKEAGAAAYLKTIGTAEADFRSNDRDNDRAQNFWVGDVRSLNRLCPSLDGSKPCDQPAANMEIRLIDPRLAEADAAPLDTPDLAQKPAAFPTPVQGYLFRALRHYRTDKIVPYSTAGDWTATHKNFRQFGFVAFPAAYGETGTRTYYMTEQFTIWWKDTGGDPYFPAPRNPAAEGWKKLE